MDPRCQKEFCSLLDDWRQQNLFCDTYLVGDDGALVPIHKAIVASKAYILLIDLNEDAQTPGSLFSGEPICGKPAERPLFKVKGYSQHVLNMFVRIIYIQDLSLLSTLDLKLQMCYFLLQISKILSMNDSYILKSVCTFQSKTQTYITNLLNAGGDSSAFRKICSKSSQKRAALTCHFCKNYFCSKSLLNCHLELHVKLRNLARDVPSENAEHQNITEKLQIIVDHQTVNLPHASQFDCSECHEMFDTKKVLGHHVEIHHHSLSEQSKHGNDIGFLCLKCGKRFATSGNLRRHQSTVHWGIRRFCCTHCGGKFGQKVTLELHLATVHNAMDNGGSNTIRMVHNKDGANAEPSLYCGTDPDADSQSRQFSDFDNLFFVNSDNGATFSNKIGDVTVNSTQLVKFIDKKKWQEKTTCNICNKQFSRPSNLKKHQLIHEAKRVAGYVGNLIEGDSAHSGSLPGAPIECMFTNSSMPLTSVEHGDEKGNEQERKGNFVCHHCGKRFLLAEYLKKHMSGTHCLTRRFSCSFCSKRFASKTRLKRHEIIHEGKKCERCSKTLEGQRAFKNHLKTSCGLPSFPIQDDAPFLFGDPIISNITFEMFDAHVL